MHHRHDRPLLAPGPPRSASPERGAALITVMILITTMMSLLAAYAMLTRVEQATTRSSLDSARGFYGAEAGLNVRAELIRQEFIGYNRPSGAAPTIPAGDFPCVDADAPGSGDFACSTLHLEDHDVMTYVVEDAGNPHAVVIPPGELYQNLHAQEYAYNVYSVARNERETRPAAILEMQFRSRLVPLFQFAAFYNKDLEILPGPNMTFAGPVHSNGDLYVGAGGTLTFNGQISTHGDLLYHGRKNADVCTPGVVSVYDPASPTNLAACGPGRIGLDAADVAAWNGMIQLGVDSLTVPPPESLDPLPGNTYWDLAELRVMLDLNDGGAVEVRAPDGSTLGVDLCGSITHSNGFLNRREGLTIEMLEVDVAALFDCIAADPTVIGGKALDDTTEGGLVWYFGVEGSTPIGTPNNYGVRLKNGEILAASDPGAPAIRGLTVVTNQAIYVQGHYNAASWKPAALMGDSLNVLSEAWNEAWNDPTTPLATRVAADTTIHAAFLAGTDVTGHAEGPAGQDQEAYNGGLENYPRFHEDWQPALLPPRTLTYLGSFVSLNEPRHVDGLWGGGYVYVPPVRNWGYDTRFNDAANLPPLSPRFVYLKQELFLRDYDL